jgi:hypothetical protein
MHIREVLTEAPMVAISPQQAQGMFGPLYHGTRGDLGDIIASGFDTAKSVPHGVGGWRNAPIGTSNGYALEPYGFTGVAAPVHHLGFGAYLTTVKAIAKQYAGGTTKGMRTFYLDSPKILTINFGSPNTMMRWWREQGYDMTHEATKNRDTRAWIAATMKLTMKLQEEYDAVWFKGKGIRKLLDGDQVCVYRPELLKVVDPKLASGMEIGAKVVHTQVIPERFRGSNVFYVDDLKEGDFGNAGRLAAAGWRGIYRGDEEPHPTVGRYPIHMIPPPGTVGIITPTQAPPHHSVKWKTGGEMYNYAPEELKPYAK